jgi:hypothetical protein
MDWLPSANRLEKGGPRAVRHFTLLMKICAGPKLWLEITGCPARHKERALRSDGAGLALNHDTRRLNSYLLVLFVRFAGIRTMNYPIEPDGGPFGIYLCDGGEGL